jgi:hypothetical protein
MAKRIVRAAKVAHWRRTIFKVPKVGPTEKRIFLHFGRPVNYRIVKLDVRDMPPGFAPGKGPRKVKWINCWGIMYAKQNKYVKDVRYTVFIPLPPASRRRGIHAQTYTVFDGRRLHHLTPPGRRPAYRGRRPTRRGMWQVDFFSGDPGIGSP